MLVTVLLNFTISSWLLSTIFISLFIDILYWWDIIIVLLFNFLEMVLFRSWNS